MNEVTERQPNPNDRCFESFQNEYGGMQPCFESRSLHPRPDTPLVPAHDFVGFTEASAVVATHDCGVVSMDGVEAWKCSLCGHLEEKRDNDIISEEEFRREAGLPPASSDDDAGTAGGDTPLERAFFDILHLPVVGGLPSQSDIDLVSAAIEKAQQPSALGALRALAENLVWLLNPGNDAQYYSPFAGDTGPSLDSFHKRLMESPDYRSLHLAIFDVDTSVPDNWDELRSEPEDWEAINAYHRRAWQDVFDAKVEWVRQRIVAALSPVPAGEAGC